MTCEPVNHEVQGVSRLITQYRESLKLIAYIKVFLAQADELEGVLCDLLDDRWIDTAEGVQLDVIGAIVGQPRTIEEYTAIPYFGMLGAIGSGSFGTLADPGIGELFRTLDDVEATGTQLDDVMYLKFIRAKIIRNQTTAGYEEIITACLELAPGVVIEITNGISKTLDITFHTVLSDTIKLILTRTNFLPIAAGVNVNYYDNNGIFA